MLLDFNMQLIKAVSKTFFLNLDLDNRVFSVFNIQLDLAFDKVSGRLCLIYCTVCPQNPLCTYVHNKSAYRHMFLLC